MTQLKKDDIIKKMEHYVPVGENGFRHFAVLVPLLGDEDPALLYEVRAKNLDRQPGEICFPGGMIEGGETPAECALRETFEEIGIPQDKVQIICELDTIHSSAGSEIHSFLGIVDADAAGYVKPCEFEVGGVFTVPVSELMEMEPEMYWNSIVQEPDENFPYEKVIGRKDYPWRCGHAPVPVYYAGEHVIWGLTGRITKQLIEILKD